MAGPVDSDFFQWVLGGFAAVAAGATGLLFRRQERLEIIVDTLAKTVDRRHEAASGKHDNDLADLWQALDDHRKETRSIAVDQERHSRDFRERTLRELGEIKAAIAARPLPQHGDE